MKIQDLQNFLQGNSNYYLGLPQYQKEQALLRSYLCNDCLINKKCTICKCITPNMFYAPQKIDSKKRWASFFTQEQWEALKNNIEDYYKFIKILNDNGITPDTGIQLGISDLEKISGASFTKAPEQIN